MTEQQELQQGWGDPWAQPTAQPCGSAGQPTLRIRRGSCAWPAIRQDQLPSRQMLVGVCAQLLVIRAPKDASRPTPQVDAS